MDNQPNNGEIPPPIMMGTTVIPTVSEIVSSTVGSAPTLIATQTGPILSYAGPRGPSGTPPPRVNPGSRPYVPPWFSTAWMGRDQPYGMSTTEMASLMNVADRKSVV